VCASASVFEESKIVSDPNPVRDQRLRALIFWALLLAFIAWDWLRSEPVDLRNEPPLIAAGSGKVATGGHCSLTR
jgi:hypothetical protein